jgi:acyl-CoA thioesterase
MGYSDQKKVYQLYDVQNERIVFSRDVTFNEVAPGFEAKDHMTYVQIDLIDSDDCEEIVNENIQHTDNEVQHTSDIEDEVEEPTPRRSTRERKRPDYYGVYINLAEVGNKPTTVAEELTGPDKDKWKSAMEAEYQSLMSNHVW